MSSYSGNTAETLAAFHEAAARGCRILAITGGGALSEECAARGWAAVHVPGGFQPRAAVGHLTFAMLGALETGGLLPSLTEAVDEVVAELERAVAELGPEAPAERNPAKALAETIGDRIPVIWGSRASRDRRDALEDADERERQGSRLRLRDERARPQ